MKSSNTQRKRIRDFLDKVSYGLNKDFAELGKKNNDSMVGFLNFSSLHRISSQ